MGLGFGVGLRVGLLAGIVIGVGAMDRTRVGVGTKIWARMRVHRAQRQAEGCGAAGRTGEELVHRPRDARVPVVCMRMCMCMCMCIWGACGMYCTCIVVCSVHAACIW